MNSSLPSKTALIILFVIAPWAVSSECRIRLKGSMNVTLEVRLFDNSSSTPPGSRLVSLMNRIVLSFADKVQTFRPL